MLCSTVATLCLQNVAIMLSGLYKSFKCNRGIVGENEIWTCIFILGKVEYVLTKSQIVAGTYVI